MKWASSPFSIDGIIYNCAEQYMMAEKARCFNDFEALEAIMATKDPRIQKAIGREVKNFDEVVWYTASQMVVKVGNIAKYSQNAEHRKELFATAGTTLVEASPYDKIWGIGLSETDPRIYDRSLWQGQNLLGQILTEIRIEMIGE